MLTVIKNGQWTGAQYEDAVVDREGRERILAFHESQGEQTIDWPTVIEFDVNGNVVTPPPTQQQIDDGVARQTKVRQRPINANQRLKQLFTSPAIKSVKLQSDMDQLMANQVTDLASARDMISKLAFTILSMARYIKVNDDELFPDDE